MKSGIFGEMTQGAKKREYYFIDVVNKRPDKSFEVTIWNTPLEFPKAFDDKYFLTFSKAATRLADELDNIINEIVCWDNPIAIPCSSDDDEYDVWLDKVELMLRRKIIRTGRFERYGVMYQVVKKQPQGWNWTLVK